jgi:hypothetical protein
MNMVPVPVCIKKETINEKCLLFKCIYSSPSRRLERHHLCTDSKADTSSFLFIRIYPSCDTSDRVGLALVRLIAAWSATISGWLKSTLDTSALLALALVRLIAAWSATISAYIR